jgi:hypothetical protein
VFKTVFWGFVAVCLAALVLNVEIQFGRRVDGGIVALLALSVVCLAGTIRPIRGPRKAWLLTGGAAFVSAVMWTGLLASGPAMEGVETGCQIAVRLPGAVDYRLAWRWWRPGYRCAFTDRAGRVVAVISDDDLVTHNPP